MVKIAFTNQKGGVAKTTSAYSIAVALAKKGKRVLCIDADPQENMAIAAGIELNKVDPEILGPEFMRGLVKMIADIDIVEEDLDEIDLRKYKKGVRESLAYVRDNMEDLVEQQNIEYERRKQGLFPGDYPTLDHVLRGEARAKDAIIPVGEDGLSISMVVSGVNLVGAEVHLADARHKQPALVLANAFAGVEKDYDYCIIDCSPAIGRLLDNILAYADYAIIPIEPALYATFGIYKLYQSIFAIREVNPKLRVLGWLLTKVKKNTSNTATWVKNIMERATFLNATVFENVISQRVAIEEAQTATMDIYSYAERGRRANKNAKDAAQEYLDVTEEMLKLIKQSKKEA